MPPKSMKFPKCPHRSIGHCKVATSLSMVKTPYTRDKCLACSTHPTTPQGINGVTCGMARLAQIRAGLLPDDKLTHCILTEQIHSPEVLEFFHKKWEELHLYNPDNWDPLVIEYFVANWYSDVPIMGCSSCASHAEQAFRKYPIDTHSQRYYFIWSVNFHNEINKATFKPTLTIQQAAAYWNNIYLQRTGAILFDDSFLQA